MSLRRITLIILMIAVLCGAAMAGEVVVPFIGGNAKTVNAGDGTTSLQIDHFTSTYSPGDPSLPYVEKYVLLPPDADPASLRLVIRKASAVDVTGTYDVTPVPPAVAQANDKRIEWWGYGNKQIKNRRNALVYGKDASYPANHAIIGKPERLDNYILVPVQFWPYKYNPAKKKLTHLKSAEVVVVYNSKAATAAASTGDAMEAERLKDLAVNWQQADSWYPVPASSQASPASTPLAIITTQAIIDASSKFQAYVAHKTSMGYSVTVATEAQWGGGTGNIASERIRAWLQRNYKTLAKYAILIGNPSPGLGDVPMKLLWPRKGENDGMEDCPSDYYYADMTGYWDYNDNGYYGEYPADFSGTWGVDRIPEVIVGRIPYYGSPTELDSIFQKIINYETAPTVGPWAERALLPMKPLDANTPCWQIGEQIKDDTLKPNGVNYYRIYEENYGLSPVPEKTPCTEEIVKNEWKKGYGFVFWSTHGSSTSAVEIFSTGSQAVLDDSRPAFTFQGSCWNGQPEDTYNLGYALLKQGAIATLSGSRVSWYFPGQTDFRSGDADGALAYAYASKLIKDRKKCGDAWETVTSTTPNNLWMNHIVFNLYGDPTVAARKATSFTIDNESLPPAYIGQSYYVTMLAAGGKFPYTWSIVKGNLPPGFTLSSAGILTGTAQKSGVFKFTILATDSNTEVASKEFTLPVNLTAYNFDLSNCPGWTCEGNWAFGKPAGKGTIVYDPTSGHTGDFVYGYNLDGDYENGMTESKHLTTSAINCSSLAKTILTFWRSLGVSSDDGATVEVSNNGVDWTTLWAQAPGVSSTMDWGWQQQTYDISSVADGQPTVYIRWGMGPTDSTYSMCGWNIDDIQIIGALSKPLITHTPLSTTENTTTPYTVTASVVAPGQLAIGSPALVYKTSGNYVTVPMTLVNGSYTAQIPPQPVNTTVSYYLTATDTIGTAVSPAGAPERCYQFQVIIDTESPVITHTPLSDTRDSVGPYHVVANVTDNIGIASVKLNWTKNGGPVTSVDMIQSTNPAKSSEYSVDIPGPAAPGDWFNYTITATDPSAAANHTISPVSGEYMFNIIPGVTRIYNFPMDSNPGWSCNGMWAFGTPVGAGYYYYKDPSSGHTGTNVYGYNLLGNYADNMTATETLTTTPLDCSHVKYTTLKFWRWLGVEGTNAGDYASILGSSNGTDWTSIWNNTSYMSLDYSWMQQSYDISALADSKANVYLRWTLGPTGPYSNYCGWNIDDVEIWGIWYDAAATVGGLKTKSGNVAVTLDGGIVSAAFNGYFYIQDADGYQGIKVLWTGSVVEGAPASICGVLRTRNGERELVAESVTQGEFATNIAPVWMATKSIGGSELGNPVIQQGTKAKGANNIGTLVKVAGKVTEIGDGYFYIDDGSCVKDGTTTNGEENIGVRVAWTGTGRVRGEFITVVGISSGFTSGSDYIGIVLPRRTTDIAN